MMKKKFISVVTPAGKRKIAAAINGGGKVIFSHMAVGDGNGVTPEPDENSQAMVNEVFRTSLNSVKIISDEKNIISTEMIMPPEVGGFTIREGALFDEEGECLVVASLPETYKPELSEGSGRYTVIRIWLSVDSVNAVEMKIDPGVVVATIEDVITAENSTKDYADEQLSDHAKSRNHPDATHEEKGFTRLSDRTDSDMNDRAATPAAVKKAIEEAIRGAWELDNPVGTVKFYAKNINPNTSYPWSTWVYTGENKSIRVGKADGTNVGQTNGSDTAAIKRENLPAEKINVSGKAESVDLNNKETAEAGSAEFNVYRFGADGRENSKGRFSLDDVEMGDVPVPVKIQPHKHTISLTVPERSVSGETEALGQGKTISVVEAHTLLMCWARTA